MTPLWTSHDAAKATGGKATADWQARGVSIDTRTLAKGDLFVALTDQRDGHEFVAQALEKGAAAALVSRVPDGVASDAPLLIVDDVLGGLEKLAIAARARTQARIVAVTGSVGKTSTKDMLRVILTGQGKTHAAADSYNNHWGVPLTLARMPVDTEFAVIEIGMNHPGEIAPLANMARPHAALITNVAGVHMEAFENLDGIAREKAAIFAGLETGGAAVINADLPVTPILLNAAKAAGATTIKFGLADASDFKLSNVQITNDATIVQAEYGVTPLLFKISAPGHHYAMNGLAALGVVQALGADLAIASLDLATWQPPSGRGKRETINLDIIDQQQIVSLIDDAFNASPISLAAALEVLAASQPIGTGRRVAILGDMLELGPDEINLHTEIAALPALNKADVIHCVGPRMAALYEKLNANQKGVHCDAAPEMATQVGGHLRAGDVILVKGSKGSKVSLVVDAIRNLGHPQSNALKGTS